MVGCDSKECPCLVLYHMLPSIDVDVVVALPVHLLPVCGNMRSN